MAISGVVFISFSAVFFALSEVNGSTATVFRAAYAIPILLVLRLLWRGHDGRATRLRWLGVGSGALLGLDLIAWHASIDMVGAGLATVAVATQVVFIGLVAWLAYRERPTATTLIFGGVVLIGIALISGLGGTDAFGVDPVRGALLGVLAGAFYAGFLFVFRLSNPDGGVPPTVALLDATVGIVAVGLVLGLVAGDLDLVPTWPAHGWLLLLAAVGQVGGWAFIAYALPRLPALTTSVILLGQPLLAVLWGWLLLDETLSSIQGIGVALVLGGMVVINLQGSLVSGRTERMGAADRGAG